MNRNEDDTKNENVATIGILKNRNGADGYYLNFRFDTSRIDIELLEDQESTQRTSVSAYMGGQKPVSKRQQKDAHIIDNMLNSQQS